MASLSVAPQALKRSSSDLVSSKPTAAVPRRGTAVSCRTYVLARCRLSVMPVMRRRCGCLDTVERVKTPWIGNAAVMMHDLRIVEPCGSQERHKKEYRHLTLPR
jgi:hypothetical protein